MGGVLTGEHGVSVEKRDLMNIQFTEEDLKQQQRLKCAFDADHLLNPGKVFPHLHAALSLAACMFIREKCRIQTCPVSPGGVCYRGNTSMMLLLVITKSWKN